VNTRAREAFMYIADRLRELREFKKLSQGDIEQRTGLLRCYVSRVENGHTVPALETLEKFARALEVPIYHLFYENEGTPAMKPRFPTGKKDWTSHGKGQRLFNKIRQSLSRMTENDRKILLAMAGQLRNINRSSKA
jgi:transcriptional regulator with XRE-family HTH domain